MKTTLLALLMLLGFSANAELDETTQACPDLSGVYTCGQDELTVDTFELSGVHYLEFDNNGGLPADGLGYNFLILRKRRMLKFA